MDNTNRKKQDSLASSPTGAKHATDAPKTAAAAAADSLSAKEQKEPPQLKGSGNNPTQGFNESPIDVPITMETATNQPSAANTPTSSLGPNSGAQGQTGPPNDDGYMDAAVNLHTGSIVFSERGTLSDTFKWLLADDQPEPAKPCPTFCYTDLCIAKLYSILLGFALVALIITVVMTVSAVPKLQALQYTKGFLPVNCSTQQASFDGRWEVCECSHGQSSFPCVEITVLHGKMERTSENGTTPSVELDPVLIRSTEEDLISDLKCSFRPLCNCDKEVNREKVIKFINIYRHKGTSYNCFYNPQNQSEVIRVQTLKEASELSKIIVPAILLVLCILAIFIILILRKTDCYPVLIEEEPTEKMTSN